MSDDHGIRSIDPHEHDALHYICDFGVSLTRALIQAAMNSHCDGDDLTAEILIDHAIDVTHDLEEKIKQVERAWSELIHNCKGFPPEAAAGKAG